MVDNSDEIKEEQLTSNIQEESVASAEVEVKTDTQPIPKVQSEAGDMQDESSTSLETDVTPENQETAEETDETDTKALSKLSVAGEMAAKFKEMPKVKTKLVEHDSSGKEPEEGDTHESVRKPMSDFEKKMLFLKIRDMDDLPIPNEHVAQIIRLLQNQEARISEVVEIIEHDQTLVAQILKLINSGFFSMRQTVSNVEQAVNLLGILQVKKLVYSASIMEMFSQEMKNEFEHAYSCSALMNTLMEQYSVPAASNLSLTMLCHDIGKVVLNRFAPKKCQLAREFSLQKQYPFNWGERHVLGLDHAEISDILLKKWEMTDDIIIPITNHHCKGVPDSYVLETALVQFVDYIDNKARGLVTNELNKHILSAAGLEVTEDDIYEWIEYQRNFITESKSNS